MVAHLYTPSEYNLYIVWSVEKVYTLVLGETFVCFALVIPLWLITYSKKKDFTLY